MFSVTNLSFERLDLLGQPEHETDLRNALSTLGFSAQKILHEDLVKTASTMMTIFHACYPEKTLLGTLEEQCKELSDCLIDMPAVVHFNNFFPMQELKNEISGEAQRQQFIESLNGDKQSYWIPIPSAQSEKETWSKEQLINHVKNGYPIYLRLKNKEDKPFSYHNNQQAILPSRVNTNERKKYNPLQTHKTLFNSRFSMIPRRLQLKEMTKRKITEMRKEKTGLEGVFDFASGLHTEKGESFEIGIKTSSIHYYFKSKDDLTIALIKRYHHHFKLHLNEIDAKATSPRQKLIAFSGIFKSLADAKNKFCLCGMMAAELQSISAEAQQELKLYFKDCADWLSTNFSILGSEKPAEDAKAYLALLEGALLIARIEGKPALLAQAAHAFISKFDN